MEIINRISFFIDHSYSSKIEEFFNEFGIPVISPAKGNRTTEVRYSIPIIFNPAENMADKMRMIYNKLLNSFPMDGIGEAFFSTSIMTTIIEHRFLLLTRQEIQPVLT